VIENGRGMMNIKGIKVSVLMSRRQKLSSSGDSCCATILAETQLPPHVIIDMIIRIWKVMADFLFLSEAVFAADGICNYAEWPAENSK